MFQKTQNAITILANIVFLSSIAHVQCTSSSVEPGEQQTSSETEKVTTDNTQMLIGIIAILAIALVVLALALVVLIRSGRYTQNRVIDFDLLPAPTSRSNVHPPQYRSRALSVESGKQCKADSAHLVITDYQPEYQPEYPPMLRDIEIGTAVNHTARDTSV